MKASLRRCVGLAAAIILYYAVHEGAHLAVAAALGVFERVRMLGLGVQVVISDPAALTPFQFAVFNAAGAAATLAVAYALALLAKPICTAAGMYMRAVCYYVTVLFLLNDPIYLSVLCGFFGGGDMNGIVRFGAPEWAVRLGLGLITLANLFLIARYVYPTYKEAVAQNG